MNEIKQSTPNREESVTLVNFWGTIAMAGLLTLLASYFASVLFRQLGPVVTYIGLAVFLLAPVAAIVSIVLVVNRRQKAGVELAFYATLAMGIMSVALFQGRALSASFSILVISIFAIQWLFPKQARRQYYAIAAAAIILMWVLEWINPAWRMQMQAAKLGPVAAGLFGLILVVIIARQAWSSTFLSAKMALLTGLLILGMISIAVGAYVGVQNLQYQLSNMYDFQLVPIVAINQADAALSDAQLHILQSENETTNAAQRTKDLQDAVLNNQTAKDVIARYNTEWVTTVSPEFTQALRDAGLLDLQQQEITALNSLNSSIAAYETSFNQYLTDAQSGKFNATNANEALNNLDVARTNLKQLIDINSKYGDFSNTTAQAASRQALLINAVVLVIGIILSLVASYFIIVSITRRLTELTSKATAMQSGDLDQSVIVTGSDEISVLSKVFNEMAARLRDSFRTLEQRIADRTRNLELAAEVGRSVSQVRSLEVMLKDACDLILKEFNLYYVQVYLADPSQTTLKLEAGTGTVGAQLVGRGHSLPLNTGSINGRAATEKHSVVIADTAQSATFRQNPLLPDTRGEMAVPLIVANKVVGVLDMQSSQPGALTEEVLPAFEALAGQLAVAVQNSNLLAETEQARAQVEAQARRLVQQGWREHLDAIHKPEQLGFVFDHNQVAPFADSNEAQAFENAQAVSAPISVTGEALGSLVVELDDEAQREHTSELVNIVARQVAQQIENLRLLESAERYRYEAEQASRRLTREGWKSYTEKAGENLKYIYDLNEVRPLNGQNLDAAATVPLKVRDEVVGKFAVQGLDANDTEAVNLANAVAERLSAHIEGLRQQDQTQSALAQSEKLFEASRRLTQSDNLQDLVASAAEGLGISEIDRVFLGALEYTSTGELAGMTIAANWSKRDDLPATAIGTHYPQEMLSSVSLFSSSEPLFFNDMWSDERIDETTLAISKRANYRAVAALPLYVGSRQDALLLFQGKEPHTFTPEETRLFTALAPQLATVLENRRQFERAQEQAKREAMLNVINQKIQSATSVEAVLQIAARELGHALGAPMTVAQLSMKDKAS